MLIVLHFIFLWGHLGALLSQVKRQYSPLASPAEQRAPGTSEGQGAVNGEQGRVQYGLVMLIKERQTPLGVPVQSPRPIPHAEPKVPPLGLTHRPLFLWQVRDALQTLG